MAFRFPGGNSPARSSATAARRAAPCPAAPPPPAPVPGLARLLFQERQPAEQVVHAELRRLHPLAQGLVFLLEVRQPVTHLGIEPRRPTACRAPQLLDVRLGLERARAPAGKLLRDRAKDRLQLVHLVHDRRISPLSVVPQARPPATAAPARAPVPLPVPAACERDRGTCSATPHCGARSGSRAPDTRQRPRRARAGLPPRGAARRQPPRPSRRRGAPAQGPARPAGAAGTDGARAAAPPPPHTHPP